MKNMFTVKILLVSLFALTSIGLAFRIGTDSSRGASLRLAGGILVLSLLFVLIYFALNGVPWLCM